MTGIPQKLLCFFTATERVSMGRDMKMLIPGEASGIMWGRKGSEGSI